MKTTLQSLRILLVLTVLTGVIYPVAMTGVALLLFPKQATGSLVRVGNNIVGSDLLAQKFESARYFWSRPSAAEYATVASGASNKGPTSADLAKAINARREKFGPDAPGDLLTASGSGLDPHISPAAAMFQVPRVAAERKLPNEQIVALVRQTTEPSQFGFLGEPRVNVLQLNRLLEQIRRGESLFESQNGGR